MIIRQRAPAVQAARAPSLLGSGWWWAHHFRPALLISHPLIDMCSHCERPPLTLLLYLLGKGSGCWLFCFFISTLILVCALLFMRATLFLYPSVCLCVPWGGGVCRRACSTQARDYHGHCHSVTLLSRVQARDEMMLVSWAHSPRVGLT